ncbi:hypothetical protein F4775DRAFT_544357 [Biscogniauxia sp. FL1348]|nr:hypothetical protein F4775DRAFT_544357 [Biscogniauxia sp. FL1348]
MAARMCSLLGCMEALCIRGGYAASGRKGIPNRDRTRRKDHRSRGSGDRATGRQEIGSTKQETEGGRQDTKEKKPRQLARDKKRVSLSPYPVWLGGN